MFQITSLNELAFWSNQKTLNFLLSNVYFPLLLIKICTLQLRLVQINIYFHIRDFVIASNAFFNFGIILKGVWLKIRLIYHGFTAV